MHSSSKEDGKEPFVEDRGEIEVEGLIEKTPVLWNYGRGSGWMG